MTVHTAPVIYYNASMVACEIDPSLFRRAALDTMVLHLSRDNHTYEGFTVEDQEMQFTLWQRPHINTMTAANSIGTEQHTSIFVGRDSPVTITLTGTHLSVVESRHAFCHFESSQG